MSTGEQRVPTPQVLKNRGVPLRLHRLVTDEAGQCTVPYERFYEGDGEDAEPAFDQRWVQFTNSVIVDLEDPHIGFGSLDAWEAALTATPTTSIVRTLALALEVWVPGVAGPTGGPVPDLRRTGKMMLDDRQDEYATVIGAAFMLSQGISPERAGEVLRAGVKNAREVRPLIDTEVAKMLAAEQESIEAALKAAGVPDTQTSQSETPSPGEPGTDRGPEPAEASTSSGG